MSSLHFSIERFLVLVIGVFIPIASGVRLVYCMREIMGRGYALKSIVVKDMHCNRTNFNKTLQRLKYSRLIMVSEEL